MGTRSRDLAIVCGLAALGVSVTLIDLSLPLLRLLLGLPLLLFCLGYALAAAFFPARARAFAREPGDPEPARRWPEWLLFALGLSLGTTILGGYLLNWTPWGLQPASWAVLLGGVTAGASVVAVVLRQRHSPPLAPAPVWRLSLGRRPAVLFGGAALLVVLAFGVAQAGARTVPDSAFTQLWILPGSASGPATVRVGLRNQEPVALRYRLVVDVGGTRAAEWPALALDPGATWEATVVLPAGAPATAPVAAGLYRAAQPATVYRQVTLRRDP
jgi:hypothetical protein